MNHNLVEKIYNAFDPSLPATDDWYLDCSAARGGSVFISEFVDQLDLASKPICSLFTGHMGTGKSSELNQLARRLESPTPKNKRFFPVLVDANQYLDEFDVVATDIFLALITEVVTQLRERLGIKLQSNYFTERFKRIKDFLFADLSLKDQEISLFGIKARIQQLKQDANAREKMRLAIGSRPTYLINEINRLLLAGNDALREHQQGTYHGLVILVDNLEKVQVVDKNDIGVRSQLELFIEQAVLLNSLAAHVTYTVPLRLAREHGPKLGLRYKQDPFVLPMIKVVERNKLAPYPPGLNCLKQLLQNRLGTLSLEQVFDPDGLDFLLKYCGGSPRHLMMFARLATSFAGTLPITKAAVEKAVGQTVRSFSTSIPELHWEKLAKLDCSATRHIENNDALYMEMLENQTILEYLNGSGQDIFASNEPWYVVHPIVQELVRFKEARDRLNAAGECNGQPL